MIIILNSELARTGVVKSVISCNYIEELNGENTLEFETILDSKLQNLIDENSSYEYNGQIFDTSFISKTMEEDGSILVKVDAEHVSYRLNQELYNLEYLTVLGTKEQILTKILQDTPFTVGTIDGDLGLPTMTYSLQQSASRRGVVMDFVALLYGEVEFNNFAVSIKAHIGDTVAIPTINNRNVKIISKEINKRQGDKVYVAELYKTGTYDLTVTPTKKYDFYRDMTVDSKSGDIKLATKINTTRTAAYSAGYYFEIINDEAGISLATSFRQMVARLDNIVTWNIYRAVGDKPSITYSCTPIYIPNHTNYALGDNILLIQNELGLRENLRIIKISKDPYDLINVQFTFAKYRNGLAESIYRIQTSSVTQGNLYNGVRISPENGFECVRSDKKARTMLTADDIRFQVGDGSGDVWTNKLYVDYEIPNDPAQGAMTLKFDGVLDANVVVTPNLYADNGNIANLTVGKMNTSVKVSNYLNNIITPVNYIEVKGQYIQYIEAVIPASGYGSRVLTSSAYDMANYPFTAQFYTNIQINQDTGVVYFFNDELVDPWNAVNSGRLYRVVDGSPNQYIKLRTTGPDYQVYYDVYETFTLAYTVSKIGDGYWDLSGGTNGIYYAGVSLAPTTGILTFDFPSGNITADQAFDFGYIYQPDNGDSTKYKKLTGIVEDIETNFVTWDVYQSSQDWDRREQYVNGDGALCYWMYDPAVKTEDNIMTTKITAFPVYIFRYNNNVKMEHSFVDKSGTLVPMMTMGLGTGTDDNGKGRIYKDVDGLYLDYYASADGHIFGMRFKNDGITFVNDNVVIPCPPAIVMLTVAEYTALGTKDPNTLYFTY